MAGNIKVIKPGKNYEQVSKAIIFDERIDLATLGFFCKVISLSDKWQLNIAGLSTLMNISTGKVQKCIAQLEECGYLKREKVQGEHGRFCGWDYTFYNLPIDTDEPIHRPSENTVVGENRPSENREVYNKTISNIKSINKNKKEYSNTPRFDFLSELLKLGVDEQTAKDWMQVRKEKKGVNTRTALDDICLEIGKAGITPQEAIRFSVKNSWCGFKAEWYRNATQKTPPVAPSYRHEEKPTLEGMMQRYGITPTNNSNYGPDEQ